jgi:hypothetical protein
MTFDPEEWLEVAEICCSRIPAVNREALLRTALNRAYYAAFLTLKLRIDLAQGRGTVPQWQTHDAIKQAVRVGGEAFKEITLVLNQLRRLRERADYLLDSEELDWNTVHGAVNTARWLVRNRIKALPDAEFRRLRVPRG